ncbi:ATP-binding cassette domain-containing protein [Clostridium polyendosporum]|uniref:ATP-binding cassette domain-containing protein n=1 Tax=Clostridium polyendosporum TaxID=69208 RepID=UPI003899224C
MGEVNITIGKGKVMTLLAPSGIGKKTLLKLISGLIRCTSRNMKICVVKLMKLQLW